MGRHASYQYPKRDLLEKAIRAKGVSAVAASLGMNPGTLRAHCIREGLPTCADAKPVAQDALKRLAAMV